MYEETVKRLRERAKRENDYFEHAGDVINEAADAIEELVRKEKFHAFLWNTIQPNEMEQYLAMYRSQAVPPEPPKEE